MLVYAGIDEAGYGPMFGPLCVGASVFVVQDHDPEDGAPDLWSVLDHIVCRRRRDRRHRIAVNDSKKLKSSSTPKGLLHLERGVLSFLSCVHGISSPNKDDDFFNTVGCELSSAPWCCNTSTLPIAVDPDQLRIDTSRLRHGLEQANVRCEMLACLSIDAATYNERTEIESKASLNFSTAMRHVDLIIHRWKNEHPRIVIDRQGGKIRYRNDIQFCWPEAHIQILTEGATMSRYRLRFGDTLATITFASKGDENHFPVAIASMVAKYTRELQMIRLNRYFVGVMPELKPTAGYVKDGRRFLKEIEPVLEKKGINPDVLVRTS
jgi:ribonuclease HII